VLLTQPQKIGVGADVERSSAEFEMRQIQWLSLPTAEVQQSRIDLGFSELMENLCSNSLINSKKDVSSPAIVLYHNFGVTVISDGI
jgi:hypothetical protein